MVKILFPNLSYNGVVSLKGYRQKRFLHVGSYYEENPDKVGILFYFSRYSEFFKRLRLIMKEYIINDWKCLTSIQEKSDLIPCVRIFMPLLELKKKMRVPSAMPLLKVGNFTIGLQLEENVPGKQIQIAIDCAKYVSSYVNSSSYLPSAFQGSQAVPKCFHSKVLWLFP